MLFKKNKVVVLLGCHRSGTSICASLLNELGVDLGDDLLPGRSDNRTGFYESQSIIRLTRSIDNKLGVAPFLTGKILPDLPGWWGHELIQHEKKELKKIIKDRVRKYPLFGFKDPRSMYQLPLWKDIFNEIDINPTYLLAIRNPINVIGSMTRRGLDPSLGEKIWLHHMASGLHYLDVKPEMVLQYENWGENFSLQLKMLVAKLGKKEKVDEELLKSMVNPSNKQPEIESYAVTGVTNTLYELVKNIDTGGDEWEESKRISKDIMDLSELDSRRERFNEIKPTVLQSKYEHKISELKTFETKYKEEISSLKSKLSMKPIGRLKLSNNDGCKLNFPKLSAIVPEKRLPARAMRVCIATEDIVGPIRNGGIGTTYTDLAIMLAKAGHDVSIYYLRGNHCENHDIEYWINWYNDKNVTFIPISIEVELKSTSIRWLGPMYALYSKLKTEQFDIIHCSEWRGSAYMCLLAKKQGLAFKNTIFCIKTSSPWLWNREYGLHLIDDKDALVKMYAEKKSVELADIVIGGSSYLLRWMYDHGYNMPLSRCFVQPNVLMPIEVSGADDGIVRKYGTRIKIDEIVFFGRLEHRKGLDIFCEAIDNLKADNVKVSSITFLGKYGANMPTFPKLSIEEYIGYKTKKWNSKVKILTDYQQSDAISYLLASNRLAVMPSRIENSTLAVYETTTFAIPFIATDVGGTSELIEQAHRKNVLVEPHPVYLADKIKEAVNAGGFIASPSFSNSKNIGEWLNFHSNLSVIIDNEKWPPKCFSECVEETKEHEELLDPVGVAISICITFNDDLECYDKLLSSIAQCALNNCELILIQDGHVSKKTSKKLKAYVDDIKNKGINVAVYNQRGFGKEVGNNIAADKANGRYLLFVNEIAIFDKDFFEVVINACASGADVLIPLYSEDQSAKKLKGSAASRSKLLFIVGEPSYSFFDVDIEYPFVIARKSLFMKLGKFTTDYKVPGFIPEFVNKAILSGYRVEIVPEVLSERINARFPEKGYNKNAIYVRTIRPYVDASPKWMQTFYMYSRAAELYSNKMLGRKVGKKKSKLKKVLKKIKKIF